MITESEIKKLKRIAENTSNELKSKEAMKLLRDINKTYHWCAEWDYMVICDESPEWKTCLCNLPDGAGRVQKISDYEMGVNDAIDIIKKIYPDNDNFYDDGLFEKLEDLKTQHHKIPK